VQAARDGPSPRQLCLQSCLQLLDLFRLQQLVVLDELSAQEEGRREGGRNGRLQLQRFAAAAAAQALVPVRCSRTASRAATIADLAWPLLLVGRRTSRHSVLHKRRLYMCSVESCITGVCCLQIS